MRILIVEDEPDLLRSLAQALREEGYAVDSANNGADGLFNAESYDYDAIVKNSKLVVDTRNATRNVKSGAEKVVHC